MKKKMIRVAESEVSVTVHTYPSLYGERKTYKQLHTEAQAEIAELKQLLTDLLLLEPSLDRFRHESARDIWGLRMDAWNRKGVNEAADLMRADTADKEKRDRVAALLKKGGTK